MKFPRHKIVRDVSILLDESPHSQPLIEMGDAPTLSLHEVISSQIVTAASQVLMEAPVHAIDTMRPLSGGVAWPSEVGVGMGYLVLPDDFLRLATIQMSDWKRPARVITAESPDYAWQSSPFAGVRGNPQRPVAAIVRYPMGRVVELYSSTEGASVTLATALYVPVPHFEPECRLAGDAGFSGTPGFPRASGIPDNSVYSGGWIDLPVPLYSDIITRCAARCREILD